MVRIKERTYNYDPKVYIEANRDSYGTDSLKTCTVGDLIEYLGDFDEDSRVYLSFDNGYTYGGIFENRIYSATADEGDSIEEIADILRSENILADDVDPEDIAEDIYDIMRDSGNLNEEEAIDTWVQNARSRYPELLNESTKKRLSRKIKENYENFNEEKYTFWMAEEKDEPSIPHTIMADNIFEAIAILIGYDDEYHAREIVGKFCDMDEDDVEEIDAIDYLLFWLDNQPEDWDRISKLEGPNIDWESNINFNPHDPEGNEYIESKRLHVKPYEVKIQERKDVAKRFIRKSHPSHPRFISKKN